MDYFGTDGVRGIVEQGLNRELVFKIGEYFASLKNKRVLIACDTRQSRHYIKACLLTGLLKGSKVTDVGITSTPCLSYLVKNNHFDFGIMITASHNPYFYNGLKIMNRKGCKISLNMMRRIESFIKANTSIPYDNSEYISAPDLINQYIAFLDESFKIDSPLNIAIDCASGATSTLIHKVLKNQKVKYQVFNEYGVINKYGGATSLNYLKSKMKEDAFDLGVAFDGDGDRVQMIYKNKVIDGDDLLYFFANKLHKDVVSTVLSSIDLKEQLKIKNLRHYQTKVGDFNVLNKMNKLQNVIGGEKSGHIILNQNHKTGDGIYVMLYLLSLIKDKNDLDKAFLIKKHFYENINILYQNEFEDLKKLKKQLHKRINQNIIIRKSGTEDLLRITFQAKTKSELKKIKQTLENEISIFLGKDTYVRNNRGSK